MLYAVVYARVIAFVFNKIPQSRPLTFSRAGAAAELARHCAAIGWRKPLIVTDAAIRGLGLLGPVVRALEAEGVAYEVFDGVLPDPTVGAISAAAAFRAQKGCDSVIAVGGGSVIDTAKIVKAMGTHAKGPEGFFGLFKMRNRGLPFAAIPTTAGTGSEATLAAVVSDGATHSKSSAIDPRLIPDMVALDPELTLGLPPALTAATAMDALTHAVESFVGVNRRPETDALALAATKAILANLERVHADGKDLEGRYALLRASYHAGMAFSRAAVGWVHAIAHNFGKLYGTPHGLANAVALAHVLDFYRAKAPASLAELARALGIGREGSGDAELARALVDRIRALAAALGIPDTLPSLKESDLPRIVAAARKEVFWTPYPVPVYPTRKELEGILREMLA